MSSTDDRIVRMQFDNANFKKGAVETQKSLADLNKAVDGAGKSKGLLDMSAQMGQVSVTASKMAVVTTTALATIANKVVNVGINMVKALTFDPIKQGFLEYEQMLTTQNTIMNATGKTAKVVKATLNELNKYSDQTIYSFSNMTQAVQKFVNAGVPLDRSVVSIKGIANAAAFAGASSEEANRAMYAFSQSMSVGYVMLQDWMQIENANMGTVKFKTELLKAAEAAGTLTAKGKGWVTSSGKFVSATKGWRDGLQDQWATTEVLNTALGKYADRTTSLGKKAFAAAQEVRTFSAFMDTLKESIGSGWSAVFTSLIGNLEQSTKMWTGVSNAVGGVVKSFFHFAATTLKTWRQMGGFEKTIQGFKNLLSPISALLGAVGDAYRKAFPNSGKGAGAALYGVSAGFEAITRPLTLLADLISGSAPVMTTFFRIFRIGGEVLGTVAGKVGNFVTGLLGLAELKAPSAGGFIDFIKSLAQAVADAVHKVDKLLQKGKSIGEAFGSLSFSMPSMPDLPSLPSMPKLPSMPDAPSLEGVMGIGGASTKLAAFTTNIKALSGEFTGLKDKAADVSHTAMFDPKASLGESRFDRFAEGVKSVVGTTQDSADKVETLGDKMGDTLGNVKETLSKFFEGFSFDDLVSSFNIAVLSTMALSISRFLNTLGDAAKGFVGTGAALGRVLDNTGNYLKSFQTAARAQMILNIGIAIGILAVSLWILSRIPVDKLATAFAGLTGIVLLMSITMKQMAGIVEKLDGKGINLKIIALGIALMALGFAMMELAIAMKIMDSVDMDGVAKGLITMFVVMRLTESLGSLGANAAKNMVGAAFAIATISASMIVLAGALLLFQLVKWESMGKAGAALGGITLAVAALALIPYEGIAKVGLALLAASVGMLAIANALVIFSVVKWESIGKAAVVLGLLTVSLAALMLVGNPVSISGLLSMSFAMIGLAGAMLILNKVDWSSIGKIALVMGILLLAFAGFLAITTVFAPVLVLLSAFAGSLALLAFALAALAAAFAFMLPVLAAGVGAFAIFATGAAVAVGVFLQTLAAEAPIIKDALLKILQSLIDGIVKAVPMIIDGFQRLWAAVKKQLSDPKKGKDTEDAGKSWIEKIKDGIKARIPMIIDKARELIVSFLKGLKDKIGPITEAGIDIVISVVNGIAKKAGDIADAATNLIIKFAQGISRNLSKILDAGVQLIADFLHRLASTIRSGSAAIGGGISDVVDAMRDVGVDMIKGLIGGVTDMMGDALGAIGDLAGNMVGKAKSILDIFSPSRVFRSIGKFLVQGLTLGIRDNAASAIVAVASMVSGQIALSESLINGFIQRLEQQTIAARAKAEGLAAAAKRAQAAANKTKTKTDDKAANQLSGQAKAADKKADQAEKRAEREKAAEARAKKWENASSLERAQMRADDARRQIESAKAAEQDAEAARVEANALDRAARAQGVTAQQRAAMRKEADRLRKQAREDAQRSNDLLGKARDSAASAMEWQATAGQEAAANFQKQYEAEAKADADAEAFDKLSASEKARTRREEAAALQAKADADLAKAKELAYTDIQAANDMADLALSEAQRARDLLDEAVGYETNGGGGSSGSVVSLSPTDAAAVAFNQYADLYDAAYAAAAGGSKVEFTQINTSPESLSPSEVYRQTNNLLTFAVDKLAPAPV